MKKPKLTKLVPGNGNGNSDPASHVSDAPANLKITNDTIAEHREKVLGKARKYIFPLQHSKHKIVLISTSLFIAAFIGFFTYSTLALYPFKSNSGFIYGVTKVIPFPVAKAGSSYVSYENYLFELRHYIHYYQTQQKVDFKSASGKQQLSNYRKQALQQVIDDAYIKQLASKNHVSISNHELNDEVKLVRSQNRLGASEKEFENVLKDNFGWTVNDFKRSLRQQMLAQKLVSTLDKGTEAQAQAAMNELNHGTAFDVVAKKYSNETASKNRGGEYGFLIDQSNRDIPARVTQTLFSLKPGQTSAIVNTGYTLEIVKNIQKQGSRVRAAHIVFTLKDIGTYLDPLKNKQKTRVFIRL